MIIEDLMKQLKLDYIETLPEKRGRIALLFQKNQLEELETEFHKMKGTGKTYGLPEVSLLGELLEKICMQAPGALTEAIPVCLKFIDEIFKFRKLDQAFLIEDSDDFQKLKLKIRKPSTSESK